MRENLSIFYWNKHIFSKLYWSLIKQYGIWCVVTDTFDTIIWKLLRRRQ